MRFGYSELDAGLDPFGFRFVDPVGVGGVTSIDVGVGVGVGASGAAAAAWVDDHDQAILVVPPGSKGR